MGERPIRHYHSMNQNVFERYEWKADALHLTDKIKME